MRRIFYHVIVKNEAHGLGEESNFDFKYIPNFDTKTEMMEYDKAALRGTGIERRNLKSLVLGCAFMGAISYVGLRITFGIGRRLLSLFG